jgi:hypothetical protein
MKWWIFHCAVARRKRVGKITYRQTSPLKRKTVIYRRPVQDGLKIISGVYYLKATNLIRGLARCGDVGQYASAESGHSDNHHCSAGSSAIPASVEAPCFPDQSLGAAWALAIVPTIRDAASSPNPYPGAINVPVNVMLTWTPAVRAASYKIYFGAIPTPSYCIVSIFLMTYLV